MLKPPSKATLSKYGLSEEEWLRMAQAQNWACPICLKIPSTGRLVIDHEHQPGWKKKPPEERKKAVRGLLCWFCNHTYVGRAITVAKAERVVQYLKQYESKTNEQVLV